LSEWPPGHATETSLSEPLPALLELDGRLFSSLTPTERKLLKRYRNGRLRHGLPWIVVGFHAQHIDPIEWLHAPSRAAADRTLRRAGAVVCIRVYY